MEATRVEIKKAVLNCLKTLSRKNETDCSHDAIHLNNVAMLTQLIGKLVGFTERENELCYTAAWLHDLVRSPNEDPTAGDEKKSTKIANKLLLKLSRQKVFITSKKEKEAILGAINKHTNMPCWFGDKAKRDIIPQSLEERILLGLFVADYIEANGARVIARRCNFVGGTRLSTPPEKGGDLQLFGFIPGKDEGLVVAIESILRLAFINPEGYYPKYLRQLTHPLYEIQRKFVSGLFKGLHLNSGSLFFLLEEHKTSEGKNIFKFRNIEAPEDVEQFKKLIKKQAGMSDSLIAKASKELARSALETVKYFSNKITESLDDMVADWQPKGRTAKKWRQKMIEYQRGLWLARERSKIDAQFRETKWV